MPSAGPESLAEYLSTEYEPSCEYVDGVLEGRNAGLRRHSITQGRMTAWLVSREQPHRYTTCVAQHVQVSPSRVRIADICLVSREDLDEVVKYSPALWIEILSPEDPWSRIQAKLADVLRFGVETVWIVDPYTRQAWIATQSHAVTEVEDGKLRCENPPLELALTEIFPEE